MQLSLYFKALVATFVTHQALGHVSAHEIINAEGILHASSTLFNFSLFTCIKDENINSTVHEHRLTA
jgi:hypothetical protein